MTYFDTFRIAYTSKNKISIEETKLEKMKTAESPAEKVDAAQDFIKEKLMRILDEDHRMMSAETIKAITYIIDNLPRIPPRTLRELLDALGITDD